ncbi:MAG: ABC transporter ATP-binding protein [Ruminococcaceae bacterium]|nr:ABC transporter ATP-binding protein [Oscillospiraceae bacterium]
MRVEQQGSIEDNIIINCENVSKEFTTERGTLKVVENFSLKVKENEFLVLFGPGQCGKTTLLNLIAGLEPANSGKITVNNKQVNKPDPERGVVYQTTALFPWLTVKGNVEFGPKVRGISKAEREKRTAHYIKLVGLEGFENSYPVKLSCGMQQRVGIARAYCNEPVVMLMDEPFGHLDAQTRYLMQEELVRIWESEKRTAIFVTNNIEEALYLADRIVVLTNCPASVKCEYNITMKRPRDYVDPEFLRLREEITNVVDKTL